MVAEVKFSALSGKTGVICDQIERRLASGHYRFGEEIYTQDLVKEFDASRAPVTAALNFLRASGYLIITPQVGCRVISPTLSDIQDFFAVYGGVEGTMAGFAALRHHSDELAQLSDIQKQIQRNTPGKGEKITKTSSTLWPISTPVSTTCPTLKWRRAELTATGACQSFTYSMARVCAPVEKFPWQSLTSNAPPSSMQSHSAMQTSLAA